MEFNGKTLSALAAFASDKAVRYVEQQLTAEEAAQARKNIGAAAESVAVVIPEQNYGGFVEDDGFYIRNVEELALTAGETYRVIWDDTEHICSCYTEVSGGGVTMHGLFLGNAACFVPVFPDTGEPFCMGSTDGKMAIITQQSGASHRVGVYRVESELPAVTTNDNDKILQVVGGAWAAVSVADSSIATFVDNYINDALGGDY